MAHYKDKLSLTEKEKVEIEVFKASITSIQQNYIQNDNSSKSLMKEMKYIKLKDVEIEYLKDNLVHKDTHITSMKETVAQKDHDVKEAKTSRSQMKKRLAKYNKELLGKVPLIERKQTIWDQLSLEVTKFIGYLEFV